MTNMKHYSKRGLALLLTLVMCLGMLQITASAAETCPECKWTGAHSSTCSQGDGMEASKEEPKEEESKVEDSQEDESKKEESNVEDSQEDETKKEESKVEDSQEDESKNEESKDPIEDDKECLHKWISGKCYVCGEHCSHNYAKGWCTICGSADPYHKHDYDENGKCVCGEQKPVHEHSWQYSMYDRNERFTHKAYCSCGAAKEEPCTAKTVYEWGQWVEKCTLCGYWEPVTEVHNWGAWEPTGYGNHVSKCEDNGCDKTKTEECKLEAFDNGAGVKCTVCGWVKYNDGTSGDGDKGCPNDEHKFSSVGIPKGNYSHTVTCEVCHKQIEQRCDLEMVLDDDRKPVAHVCRICGQWKPIEGDNYCKDGNAHDYDAKKEVLSEDGKSVLTTQTCKICGYTMVQSICNSPAHVTVKYVFYEDGKKAHEPQSQAVIKGTHYEIKSPEIEGYEPDQKVVSGVSKDGKDEDYTVIYKKVETKYTLTIEYVDHDTGKALFDPYKDELAKGEYYKVESEKPPKGYEFAAANEDIVNGTMPGEDLTIKVSYKPITYTQTIVYVIEGKDEPFATTTREFTINTMETLESVVSPVKEGYTVDLTTVSAPDKLENTIVKVTYTPSTSYKLVVNHEYVAHDGTRTVVMETLGDTHKVGDSYTTTATNREGYTLSATPENASGTFGATDVTVTYVYNENTFTVTWLDGYDGTVAAKDYGKVTQTETYNDEYPANPTRDGYTFTGWGAPVTGEDGNITITAQWRRNGGGGGGGGSTPTPTPTPDPDPEEPSVDVPDPDVPLVDLPDEDVPLANIPEEEIPLAEIPEEFEIPEEEIPLANVPRTGDISALWYLATLMSAGILAFLGLRRKDR